MGRQPGQNMTHSGELCIMCAYCEINVSVELIARMRDIVSMLGATQALLVTVSVLMMVRSSQLWTGTMTTITDTTVLRASRVPGGSKSKLVCSR